jgi:hypothetical protein
VSIISLSSDKKLLPDAYLRSLRAA